MYVMAFGDLVNAARKTSTQHRAPTIAQNDLADALTEEVKAPAQQKKDISYKDSEIKGFVPGQRTFGARTNLDPKHGSIIRNISSQSDMNKQNDYGGVTWEECKHRKSSTGKDFCAEYHSLCYKDKCKKARK